MASAAEQSLDTPAGDAGAPSPRSAARAPARRSHAATRWLVVAVFSVGAGCRTSTALPIDAASQCRIESDSGVDSFGATCYAESTKPSGACSPNAHPCHFCSYPSCSIVSGLLVPHTFYDCSCVAGAWSCVATSRFGTGCPSTISCLRADGKHGAVCLNDVGLGCAMDVDGGGPVCFFADSPPAKKTAVRCGTGWCANGCVCTDASSPTCTCQ
jgi:hypothetical protein